MVANTPAAKNIGIARTLMTKHSSSATSPAPTTTNLPVTCTTKSPNNARKVQASTKPAVKLSSAGAMRGTGMAPKQSAGRVRCRIGSIARQDHVLQQRIDLRFPLLAGEHPVVAGAGLHVVALTVRLDAGAQVLRGERLANRADVVLLAFHGEQRGALDRARLDGLATERQRTRRHRT